MLFAHEASRMMCPQKWFKRLLPMVLGVCCLLTGCVDYDVGIRFPEQHYGEIVQHITLGEQLTTLSQAEADRWLKSLDQRAKDLNGHTDRPSEETLVITIPFGSGQELVEKFNRFFNPQPPKGRRSPEPDQLDLLNLKAELALEQSNWLLADRNHLKLTVDLRALGVLSNQGNIILSPGSLINLNFDLQTPLTLQTPNAPGEELGTEVPGQWQLKPGQINVIETTFFVPSYLAIGTILIIILCLGGFYLKYGRWPGVLDSKVEGV
ncbi:slr1724 [Synechocystis sp. PCC 6803]|uniref:Slr1724 protein n=2 Tax=Synechocystis TaxID=1142 RepID=P73856_SYNY3|nr:MULTISPECIES: DUF3153 domain-containing protein [unclassified Synechocystis]MBD2619526.1 DUF3153 domain-containing protein [Synechocystis sp. FACHB-898]MBD2639081.1 DUF3153 domain-containing protein [Synechocystis sp. FACHB-908]MBD2662196.1 DUF3153 domain-containing protein [Synechocystis sp. FACHB-929]BAL29086.1 hypothetical protein SYNGTI_1339 [Synechocystis sp. PCC 6803 substr. GT-I]BAL32255.1 hypothetical protein SYNPCCN_1338 [Synechocystis sp. PCC 6803 substr. PCC-N]BAL35424.1 hypothe